MSAKATEQTGWSEHDFPFIGWSGVEIPVFEFSLNDKVIDNQSELSILLLKEYGDGPAGKFDVLCVFNHAINTYTFIPAHLCDWWAVDGGDNDR